MFGLEVLTASIVFSFGGAITMAYQYLLSVIERPIASRVRIYNGN
tara:strand:+ start:540 stop:674 length:135 start_codon:yes stop_codon:yes gene_type:complete